MKKPLMAVALAALSPSVCAQTTTPALAGISFLTGDWAAGQGSVAETGGTSKGYSTITREAGGNVLLRRDHTDLFDATGKPAGGFDQIMMIYPEDGTLHADYSDGTHIIHYACAEIVAGSAVTFTSAINPRAPTFRLRYQLVDQKMLTVAFQMAPPGSADFHPIATGSLTKVR